MSQTCKRKISLFLTVALTLLLASCSRKTVYSHYEHTPQTGWERNDTLKFVVPVSAISGDYAEEVGLRLTSEYRFQELCLVIEQSARRPVLCRRDTLNCTLVDDRGAFQGKGTFYFQYSFPLVRQQLEPGDTLYISVRHNMKREILQGIEDVGIRLYRTSRQ